jgi:TolB-like protein
VAVAVGIWQFYEQRLKIEPASEEKVAFTLPEKPSVAVLPFVNMTGDPDHESLADGVGENITTALSTTPDIFVIDRNSALRFKEKSVKVKEVAEELGVQYVVEGSLQKAGAQIQLTTRILDALKGRNLWAANYKKDLNDIFDAQDEAIINILKVIYVKSIHGLDAEFYFNTKSIEAIKYFKRGRYHHLRLGFEDRNKAVALYRKALEIDPDYAAAWAELALLHQPRGKEGSIRGGSFKDMRKFRNDYLAKALKIDSTIPMVHSLLAEIHQRNGQYERGLEQLEKAMEKTPKSALLHYKMGELLSEGGRPQDAIALIERAIRLNPFYPGDYLFTLSQSYFLLQEYDNGLQIAKKLLDRGQKEGHKKGMLDWGHLWSAINLVELEQIEKAQAHMKEYLKLWPATNVNMWDWRLKNDFQNPADLEPILNAMHKAGLRRWQ